MLTSLTGSPGAEKIEGAYGRMRMTAAGKDSTSGHWELAGVVLPESFPLFPDGFPEEAVQRLETVAGRRCLGNRPSSGTTIIEELGDEHVRTGSFILYTSADSVCQLAAHVDVIPLDELYEAGEHAREIMAGPYDVARVIVRPFAGEAGNYYRLHDARRDFSRPPPAPTLLDMIIDAGLEVHGVGKVDDIFAGRGFSECRHIKNNAAGIELIKAELRSDFEGLLFANLNDTDTVFGHRNDAKGYARALAEFDAALPAVESEMNPRDLLLIVSDHGNDPTTPSTDHSREYTPVLAWHPRLDRNVPLGTRETLADVGQTIARNFSVGPLVAGASFLNEISI
jgi:phosphopentomutase